LKVSVIIFFIKKILCNACITFTIILFINPTLSILKAQENVPKQLKILTWNIYSLPFIINNSKRIERAEGLVESLKHLDYDIVVLQETFHKKSFKIIEEGLKQAYPYQVKANRKSGFLKYHHGIFIISKLPAKVLGTITYKNCKGSDCLAKKGAILIELEKDGQIFQVLGTHLQAMDEDKHEAIRKTQRKHITTFLNKHKKASVPQLLCGDFNTNYNDLDRRIDLLNDLEIPNANVPDEITWPHKFYATKKTHSAILDYIFIKPNNFIFSNTQTKVHNFYDNKRKLALSDHSAVEMRLIW